MVKCAWVYSCLCFSRGCSAKWEAVGQDTTLPIMVPGEEVPGAAARGEEEAIEASPPEVSPEVEGEALGVRECEAEAEVAARDVRIKI